MLDICKKRNILCDLFVWSEDMLPSGSHLHCCLLFFLCGVTTLFILQGYYLGFLPKFLKMQMGVFQDQMAPWFLCSRNRNLSRVCCCLSPTMSGLCPGWATLVVNCFFISLQTTKVFQCYLFVNSKVMTHYSS